MIRDLRFADDCALNANNEQKMQLEMDGFSTACDNFGLTISTKKTEVMSQSATGNPYQEHDSTVKRKRLHAVAHPLAGQYPGHRGAGEGTACQRQHYHAQSTDKLGRSRLPNDSLQNTQAAAVR